MSPLVRESFTRRVFLAQHYDEIATALNRQYKAIDNAIYRACRDLPAIASRLADDDDLPVDVRGVLAMMARKKVRLVNEERCTKKRKRSVDFWMGDLLSKVV
jgi:hypothetical protein